MPDAVDGHREAAPGLAGGPRGSRRAVLGAGLAVLARPAPGLTSPA